ncbi:MAG: hypothetical protein R2879_16610 [Saprospiraceae bacterium]
MEIRIGNPLRTYLLNDVTASAFSKNHRNDSKIFLFGNHFPAGKIVITVQ